MAAAALLHAQPEIVVVDAAAFQERSAAGMLASGFTSAIPDVTATADTFPLPTALAGFSLEVEDAAGQTRPAELIGVFNGQINFVTPGATALGIARVRLRLNGQIVAEGEMLVTSVAPGLFTANASGEGVPAGFVLFSSAAGSRQENLFELDPSSNTFRPRPFSMSNPGEEVRLILFGTGIRGRTDLANIVAQINGVSVAAEFAGDQGQFRGLDQVNLGPLPRILDGVGAAPVSLLLDAVAANVVDITIGGGGVAPAAPVLASAAPNKAAAGETVALVLSGQRLTDVSGVEITPPDGVTFSLVQASGNSISAQMTVAADAVAGARMIRVVSASGASNSLPFSIVAATGLSISNLTFNATATASGTANVLVFSGGFDFAGSKGNIVSTGNILTSARIEQNILSNETAQRCTFLLAGSALSFPNQTSGQFSISAIPPFAQNDIGPGTGRMRVTLIAPDGERSKTLESAVSGVPLCDPSDPLQAFVFP